MNATLPQATLPLVVAMTGASGAGIAIRLLECLRHAGIPLQLIVSDAAVEVLRTELDLQIDSDRGEFVGADFGLAPANSWWRKLSATPPRSLPTPETPTETPNSTVRLYGAQDLLSPLASGSHLTRGMVICPCSGSTLGAIAHSIGTNLIHRAAEVHLKERRRLVLVPRETPLSTPMLENMTAVSRHGAIVLPASPGWYHGVDSVFDLIDFVVARILDQFQIPHGLMKRWGNDSEGP